MSEAFARAHLNRILIVDDTAANLRLLSSILTERGYIVHPASSGELALLFLQVTLPDLILLDVKMPGLDGYEVCRRLKADARTCSIPVIFISALADVADKINAFQAGGVDFITTPFEPEEILARVRAHLSLRELTERLEQKVVERTEELTIANQRLQQEISERRGVEDALRASEERYRVVFENSPISIWEEDFSGVMTFFDDLRAKGVTDLDAYLAEHPDVVRHCADLARIVEVNRAALVLHATANKEELLAGLASTFTPESFATFRQELVCLWNGGVEMVRDAVVKTLAGNPRHVTVYFSVCPGYERTLSKVLVSLVDITERKRAEEALRTLNEELDIKVHERTVELEAKNAELARTNRLFVGRELRMVELKDRIRSLEERLDGHCDQRANGS